MFFFKVFILSSSPGELTKNPKKILRVLWSFIIFGLLWTVCSCMTVNWMTIKEDHIWLKWINSWFEQNTFYYYYHKLSNVDYKFHIFLICYLKQVEITIAGFIFRPSMFKTILKALVIYTTLCQDAVQATVIACYCIQVQLLKYQLQFLRERLVQRTIQPLDWMRASLHILIKH